MSIPEPFEMPKGCLEVDRSAWAALDLSVELKCTPGLGLLVSVSLNDLNVRDFDYYVLIYDNIR